MERWGTELLNAINRIVDNNVPIFIFLFLMLFSFDSTEIFSIPIPWIAIGIITGVSLFKLFTHEADFEMKFVFIIFVLLFIQNISSFVAYDSSNELFSQYTYLRFLNFISFFICFLFIAKSKTKTEKIIETVLFTVLISSSIGLLIYIGQVFDLFDIIRNRPGTGIYGQEEQVTFWLSENHRAMSTFREPIFFASFLLPLAFVSLCSRSRLVYPAAIISGCVIGLTRSDLIFFTVASALGFILISFVSKKIDIKSHFPIILFFIFSFIGYSLTVRECDVNKSSNYCTLLLDTEAPVWTSDPVSFGNIQSDSFDILWGNANDNKQVTTYKVVVNGVTYIEVDARSNLLATYRITYTEAIQNSIYDVEVIAGDYSGNWSTNNPRNSITIGEFANQRPVPTLDVEEVNELETNQIDNSNNNLDKLYQILGEERVSIFEYIRESGTSFEGVGILDANYEYTKFFSNKNLISNYLTIRTSPEYMSVRYKSQAFGTGDTYYLYGSINLQNLFIFNYIAHGAIFIVLTAVLILSLMKEFIGRKEYFIYVMMATATLLIGVFEELSSFQGIIFGIIYSIYKDKEQIE